MDKIVLHVGDRKTATTSIQAALLQEACRSEVSLIYPVRADRPNHHYLVKEFERAAGGGTYFERLAETLRATHADIAVLSSERLESADPAALKAAFEHAMPDLADRLHVVGYVRPQAERLPSSYSQVTKMGHFDGSLDEYCRRAMKRGNFLYAPRAARWREAFGDRYTLRPMVRDRLVGGDMVSDFFHTALGGAAFTLAPSRSVNESLSVADLALMRMAQRHLKARCGDAFRRAQIRFGQHMTGVFAAAPEPDAVRPALDRALAEEVAATYHADAARLDAEVFEGTPLSDALARAPDRAVAEPQSFDVGDHFDAATLRAHRLWLETLGDFLARDPDGWSQHAMQLFNTAMRGGSDGRDRE